MESPSTSNRPLPIVLRSVLTILVLLWGASLVFAAATSHPLSSGDGFKWLFFAGPAFDYYDYIGRMYYLHQPEFFTHPGYAWYYPAAGVFPLQFFYGVGRLAGDWHIGYFTYIAVAVAGTLFAAWHLALAMKRRHLSWIAALGFSLGIGLFSWPIYFSLQRGNIESITWLILAGALWATGRKRWILAALLLGVVSAFKLYPALCFALFLKPRRWKELALGLCTMAATTLAALRYLNPSLSLAFRGVRSGMAQWLNDYAMGYGPASATYDHSFYELIKVLTADLHPIYAVFMRDYMVVAGVLALILFFSRVIHMPETNQVLFLVTCSVFLPPASFDYTLQNLYIPFAWLVLSSLQPNRSSGGTSPGGTKAGIALLLLFACIFGPEIFLMLNEMTAAGLFKGVLLLAVICLSVLYPLQEICPASSFSNPRLPLVEA